MPPEMSERMAKEARKIGLGMLSTRMQRAETGVTGRSPRGPAAITADPELFSVVVPHPPKAERNARPAQRPEEHPKHLRSGTDLLWRDGRPQPPSGGAPQRVQFSRYLPSHNKGNPTSSATLEAIAARKADDVFHRAHAARAPAKLAVRLSREVLQMCKEHGIDAHALMREGANPLSSEVHVMHGPYTPSWEYAIGEVAEPGFDPDTLPIGGVPSSPGGHSARSAPAGSGRKAAGRVRAQ